MNQNSLYHDVKGCSDLIVDQPHAAMVILLKYGWV